MTLAALHPTARREDLAMAVQYIKGVGPSKAEILSKVDVRTLEDLLHYFPRSHQDRRVEMIRSAVPGTKAAYLVDVIGVDFLRSGKMLGQARARVRDASGGIDAIWFKRLSFRYDVFSSLKRDIVPGQRVLLYGAIEQGKNGLELRVEDHEAGDAVSDRNKIVPVYPLTEGLTDRWLRSLTSRMVPASAAQITDPVPAAIRANQKLADLPWAISKFHFPANWAERDKARERLAFDEFFFLELALAMNRHERTQQPKRFSYEIRRNLLTPFREKLGFEFTRAQTRVINEIFRDMQRPIPMNRLLQGDVGSGKTVVALSAALLAIENGYQAAFLAPTEILAEQHALSLERLFKGLPVKTALLTGSTARSERTSVLNRLKEGKIDLVVGTHAILGDDVVFRNLSLVVIDEQHRFGVRQRSKLVIQRDQPDTLIMTATPIPRTLALTLYGDLDVSTIDAPPAGRTAIKTRCVSETAAFERIAAELQKGRQAYVVFPLVEESELLSKRSGRNVKAATKEFERIQARFPDTTVALLHGQMPSQEKKRVMDAFRANKISVLVATPVIEVGIDVANATVMVIDNPERFGLAQLHQLRGRVGRGSLPSECLLIHADDAENENPRLSSFCLIEDGFQLAEEDLKLRGPGEFIGEAQHGLPLFRVGDLINDGLLIARARDAAKALVMGEVSLTFTEISIVNRILEKKFGAKLHLSRVG